MGRGYWHIEKREFEFNTSPVPCDGSMWTYQPTLAGLNGIFSLKLTGSAQQSSLGGDWEPICSQSYCEGAHLAARAHVDRLPECLRRGVTSFWLRHESNYADNCSPEILKLHGPIGLETTAEELARDAFLNLRAARH